MDYEIQKDIEENMKNTGSFEPFSLTVEHILGALYLLLIGHLFGIIVFFVEFLCGNDNKLLVFIYKILKKRK